MNRKINYFIIMIVKYLLITILILPLPSLGWDKTDTQKEIAWQILNIIDWGTTLDIENHPDIYEINPILGKYPSRNKINIYAGTSAIVHYLISKRLKPKYRKYWQNISIMISGGAVINNYNLGLRINF